MNYRYDDRPTLTRGIEKGGNDKGPRLFGIAARVMKEGSLTDSSALADFDFIEIRDDEKDIDRKERVVSDLVEKYGGCNIVSKILSRFKVNQASRNEYRHPTPLEFVELFYCIERGFTVYECLLQENRQPTVSEQGELALLVAARQAVMSTSQGLVVSIAKKRPEYYLIEDDDSSLTRKEMIQMGNEGLSRAIVGFDVSLGNRFSTYATWWIRQKIDYYLAKELRTIRLPSHIIEKIKKIEVYKRDFYKEKQRYPTDSEISNELGISKAEIEQLSNLTNIDSLNRHLSEDGRSVELGAMVSDPSADVSRSVEQLIVAEELREGLSRARLTRNELFVVCCRYMIEGIIDQNLCRHSLTEIAREMNIKTIDVRRIERSALKKIERALTSNSNTFD